MEILAQLNDSNSDMTIQENNPPPPPHLFFFLFSFLIRKFDPELVKSMYLIGSWKLGRESCDQPLCESASLLSKYDTTSYVSYYPNVAEALVLRTLACRYLWSLCCYMCLCRMCSRN